MNNSDATDKRQLIFVWNYTNWGGAQIFLIAIMKIAKLDWDVLVLLPKNSLPDILRFLEEAGIRYEFLNRSLDGAPALTVGRKIERQWRRIRAEVEVLAVLKRFDLKRGILHIETGPWQSWMLLTALSLRGANIFVTMHNFLPDASKAREFIWRLRFQYISRLRGMHIIASNRDTKNRMKGWVSGKFWESVTVAHTCVDPQQIANAACSADDVAYIKRSNSIPSDKFVVMAVGQFIDRKGRWIFIEAARKVLATDPAFHFVWLTPQMPDAKDQKKTDSFGLGDAFQIVLSNTVGTERLDVLRFFNAADIFALPSYVEGLPIALLEAMALGISSISTNVYAIPEAVKHHETGILIEPGDANALAEWMIKLKEDPDLRRRLGKCGSEFVLENFDERDAARKCIAAYEECFADGK